MKFIVVLVSTTFFFKKKGNSYCLLVLASAVNLSLGRVWAHPRFSTPKSK